MKKVSEMTDEEYNEYMNKLNTFNRLAKQDLDDENKYPKLTTWDVIRSSKNGQMFADEMTKSLRKKKSNKPKSKRKRKPIKKCRCK
jgi:hypothetical protein